MGDTPTIRQFLQAGYPAVYLPTGEYEIAERRIRAALMELEDPNRHRLAIWKATSGMVVGRFDTEDFSVGATVGPKGLDASLKYVVDESRKEPPQSLTLIVHNPRQFMANHMIIQHLIDAVLAARLVGSFIFLVGPTIELPPELKNLVTYCDCPLPTHAQILKEYVRFVKAYKNEITLPKDKKEARSLIRNAATAAMGLDSFGAENAISLSFATSGGIDLGVIQTQKEQEIRKSDVLEFVRLSDDMDSVGGFSAYKAWLSRRKRAFTDEARQFGLPYPKGILLVGSGGTGKSLAAKATASYLGLPLLRLDIGKIFRSLVGDSESAIRMALKVAEAVSPIVLWLDEIDKGFAGMSGSGNLDSGVTARVLSTILTWRQETTYPVPIVATANDVSALPSMIYRKGRFDEVWGVGLPSESERETIFQIHINKRKRNSDDFDCAMLASLTDGFVGAEIEACVEDALFAAFDVEAELSDKFIMASIQETIPQSHRSREELDAIDIWIKERARYVSGGDLPKVSNGKSKIRVIKNPK